MFLRDADLNANDEDERQFQVTDGNIFISWESILSAALLRRLGKMGGDAACKLGCGPQLSAIMSHHVPEAHCSAPCAVVDP